MPLINKSDLREQIINVLKNLDKSERELIQLKLAQQLFQSTIWQDAFSIGTTCSTGLEWDTRIIIRQAWKEGKIISVPKVDAQLKQMSFYQIDSFDDLQEGYARILEPKENPEKLMEKNKIDLLIVPGVVFDKEGFRIGFGGGYYDRFLATYAKNTASLVSHIQIINRVPREDHDIPVQYLITEDKCI